MRLAFAIALLSLVVISGIATAATFYPAPRFCQEFTDYTSGIHSTRSTETGVLTLQDCPGHAGCYIENFEAERRLIYTGPAGTNDGYFKLFKSGSSGKAYYPSFIDTNDIENYNKEFVCDEVVGEKPSDYVSGTCDLKPGKFRDTSYNYEVSSPKGVFDVFQIKYTWCWVN